MNRFLALVCSAFALVGLAAAVFADDSTGVGRRVFERRCQTCHGGTGPSDSAIGPSLAGIVGRKAGADASGIHSRSTIDSGIVWDRASLRRFLSHPSYEIPNTIMVAWVEDPAELERLLDYLEALR
jgi:cytochrome c2